VIHILPSVIIALNHFRVHPLISDNVLFPRSHLQSSAHEHYLMKTFHTGWQKPPQNSPCDSFARAAYMAGSDDASRTSTESIKFTRSQHWFIALRISYLHRAFLTPNTRRNQLVQSNPLRSRLPLLLEDCLDIIPIDIMNKCRVICWTIVGSGTGISIALAARFAGSQNFTEHNAIIKQTSRTLRLRRTGQLLLYSRP
jgi:hypothetical protein